MLIKVDTIGEYVSYPKNVLYIQELGIVHIQGILYKDKNIDKYFIIGEQFKIVVWIRKEIKIFIDNHCLRRLVNLSFVKIKYGRDSLELLLTEFSKVLISNYVQSEVNINELVRYEYPAQAMSLREMIESGMVAISSVAITYFEERVTEDGKAFAVVYLYDSTAIVRLYLFDSGPISEKFNEFSNDHSLLISHHEKYVSIDPEKITCPQCIKRYHDVKKNKPEDLYSPSNFKLNYPPNNDPFKFFEND